MASSTMTVQESPYKSHLSIYLHRKEQNDFVARRAPENPFDLCPEELVDRVLSRLQAVSMELIEWRSLLYRRMGVPLIVKDYCYVVPDKELKRASDIISDMGLPRFTPPSLLLETSGDLHAKGNHYRLTRSSALSEVQFLILFPLSFASFCKSELISAPRLTSLPSPKCTTILIPREAAVYASMLRTMLAYPLYDSPTRSTLESELSELIDYNLYDLQIGFVDMDDEEQSDYYEIDRRIEDAVQVVRGWGWDGEWRPGEEWMGDALVAVVQGEAEFDSLPSGS